MKKLTMLFLIACILCSVNSIAVTDIVVFYGQGCPHCEKAMSFLEKYNQSNVNVSTFEVYFDQNNRALFESTVHNLGKNIEGVPTIVIDDEIFVGFSDSVEKKISKKITDCKENSCQNPLLIKKEVIEEEKVEHKNIAIPAVISAAAVDAINPCAFAVLIILITTILASKKRKRALFAGLAFSFSIFISYFLMGIGLYSAINAAEMSYVFFIIVAVLAIIIGFFNLKDFFWYGKWFVMEVPLSWRPKLKALIHKVTSVPGAFLTGFAVSLFLLPCTSGPYIVILGLLSETASRQFAILLLLLYNVIFILPMIIITLAVFLGITSTEKAENWRKSKLKVLHLIAGLILVSLGILMILGLTKGII